MASYQEIDTRLRVIEDMLQFVMSTCRMKFGVSSGLSGPDGRPLPPEIKEASILEVYRLSRSLPHTLQSDDAIEVSANGTD